MFLICWEMDLIGGEFLALDGCKFPSNSAKEWSGTFADLEKKEKKIRKTVDFLVDKHKKLDRSDPEKKTTKSQIEKITAKADKIKDYLETHQPKIDSRGKEIQSNIPESRDIYSKRMGIVEPVFGNIRACKRMDRLNYRGYRKVNCQWRLYSMVHNIEKVMRAMRN